MQETAQRLEKCFQAVFPTLAGEQIKHAQVDTVEGWDSVANITLLTVIGEEFGLMLDMDDFEQFTSYKSLLAHLTANEPGA